MTAAYVLGTGMVPFGKHTDKTVEEMGRDACWQAIQDAGIDPRRIEAAYCGHVFQGMNAGQRVLVDLGITGFPVYNLENACASGSSAVLAAAAAIAAGQADLVLAFGVEKLTDRFQGALTPDPGDLEGYQGMTMPASYALRAHRYMEEFGLTREQLAQVSVKNRRNAAHNPNSQFHQPVTVDEVLGSRLIADPLRKLDCCPVSDGAAAVVLGSAALARQVGARAIRIAGGALTSGKFEDRPLPMTFEDITHRAAQRAYAQAGCGPGEIDVVEVHDCFTIAEILRVEGLGLFPRGEAGARIAAGEADIGGRLPINPSGGLIGKGHPLGATGVAQLVEITTQLRQEAGVRQVEGAKVGLAHCRGGSVAGTEGGACTILILTR